METTQIKIEKPETTMRIVQITDLHVGQPGEDTQGVDVRANFLKIKAAIEELQPDHLGALW